MESDFLLSQPCAFVIIPVLVCWCWKVFAGKAPSGKLSLRDTLMDALTLIPWQRLGLSIDCGVELSVSKRQTALRRCCASGKREVHDYNSMKSNPYGEILGALALRWWEMDLKSMFPACEGVVLSQPLRLHKQQNDRKKNYMATTQSLGGYDNLEAVKKTLGHPLSP